MIRAALDGRHDAAPSCWPDDGGRLLLQGRLVRTVLRLARLGALVDVGLGLLVLWLVLPVTGIDARLLWPVGLSAGALVQLVDAHLSLRGPTERLARPAGALALRRPFRAGRADVRRHRGDAVPGRRR